MIHKLHLETKNLHGSFNNSYEPILTIDSGDSIQLKTLDIQWGYSGSKHEERSTFESRENEEKLGHPLIGPISIRNAKPGMVLEVRVNELIPGWYGRNFPPLISISQLLISGLF